MITAKHNEKWLILQEKVVSRLKKFGKTYEFHSYDNAGHAFFSVNSTRYRPAAAMDGWKRVFAWYEKYLQ